MDAARLLTRRTAIFALAFALIAASFVARRLLMANSDVAWLLTVAERWLDGQRLYVDVLENNPPFAVWMYAPAVLLARLTALRAEAMIDVIFVGLAATSAWIFAVTLRAADVKPSKWLSLCVFAALALLPAACFGEREHLALALFLPPLAIVIARAAGAKPGAGAVILAGLLNGGVICIKPHFALACAGAAAAAAIVRGSWRPIFAPEHFIAGALFIVYAASTFVFYPAYWNDVMPVLRLLYLPVRTPFFVMLHGQMTATIALVVIVCAIVGRIGASLTETPRLIALAAVAGFLGAALAQGKGWPYHFYPAFGLLVIVLADASLCALTRPRALIAGAATLALSAQVFILCIGALDMSVLEAPMRSLKSNPRAIGIVSDFSAGFPTIRAVNGTWVGRSYSRWATVHARHLLNDPGVDPALHPALRAAEEADRRQVATDIREHAPDIVMVELRPNNFLRWALSDPELAALMSCYRAAGRHGIGQIETPGESGHEFEVELYVRSGCSVEPAATP